MRIDEARIGVRVKSLVDFAEVPKGTEGVVDEDYGTGVKVAWDLYEQPLPRGYLVYDGKPAFVSGILRYSFDKRKDLHYLGKV
jgi:hypothetical protein